MGRSLLAVVEEPVSSGRSLLEVEGVCKQGGGACWSALHSKPHSCSKDTNYTCLVSPWRAGTCVQSYVSVCRELGYLGEHLAQSAVLAVRILETLAIRHPTCRGQRPSELFQPAVLLLASKGQQVLPLSLSVRQASS